jgi:hypothetical protein
MTLTDSVRRDPVPEPATTPNGLTTLRERLLEPSLPPDATGCDLAELWAANPEAMLALDEAYLECQRFLHPRDQPMGREQVLGAARAALELIRQPIGDAAARTAAVAKVLTAGAAHAGAYVSERAERRARRSYARGLVLGALVSIVLLALLGLVAIAVIGVAEGVGWRRVDGAEYWALRDALVCVGGGAAGAVVSVLLRLGQIEHLEYKTIDWGAAVYRVAIGWFFAAAVLFLIKGGIVTVLSDPSAKLVDGTDTSAATRIASWFWWGGLGFLAGFNERWARNLLARDPSTADRARAETVTRRRRRRPTSDPGGRTE